MSVPFKHSEIETWKTFVHSNQSYDLSHLNAHKASYLDVRNNQNYDFIVTYSFHCFTCSYKDSPNPGITYQAPLEKRPFDFGRYHLSKQLPEIIHNLHNKEMVQVGHAKDARYAAIKLLNHEGIEVDYYVVFNVFREFKKYRIHISSAYPNDNIGKVSKVDFFSLAVSLAKGRKLPKPPPKSF